MKLTFLGTRANIDAASARHRRHSALRVAYQGTAVVIDCGLDWLEEVKGWSAAAILLTHAHPDHAFGLRDGASCPVHATEETWEALAGYPIADRRTIAPRRAERIGSLVVVAFPAAHSLRAPAVGYRLAAGRRALFYAPDVVDIAERREALAGVDLYVGDGATLTRPLVRRRNGQVFGHTTVRAQLGWCAEAGVKRAVFTHCGKEVVADEAAAESVLRALAEERGVSASFAHDGLTIVLR